MEIGKMIDHAGAKIDTSRRDISLASKNAGLGVD
jgi:hypothetical protein